MSTFGTLTYVQDARRIKEQRRYFEQRKRQAEIDKARRHVLVIEARTGTGVSVCDGHSMAQAAPVIRDRLWRAEARLGIGAEAL